MFMFVPQGYYRLILDSLQGDSELLKSPPPTGRYTDVRNATGSGVPGPLGVWHLQGKTELRYPLDPETHPHCLHTAELVLTGLDLAWILAVHGLCHIDFDRDQAGSWLCP